MPRPAPRGRTTAPRAGAPTTDLRRDGVAAHVPWFPRTSHAAREPREMRETGRSYAERAGLLLPNSTPGRLRANYAGLLLPNSTPGRFSSVTTGRFPRT